RETGRCGGAPAAPARGRRRRRGAAGGGGPPGRGAEPAQHGPARRDQRPQAAAPGLQRIAVTVERQREGGRDRGEHESQSHAVVAGQVGEDGDQREQSRERSAGHPGQASRPYRMFLYVSQAPVATKGALMADATLTWLGHGSFRLDTPGGKRVYVDPWFDNPKCPDSEKDPERCDVIAGTHGHGHHTSSVVDLSKKFGPVPIVAMVELKGWLKGQGAQTDDVPGPNKGGTVEAEGIKFTLVNAFHSSAADDDTYLGEAAGIVTELED